MRATGNRPAHQHTGVRRRIIRQSLEQGAALFALGVHDVQPALPIDSKNGLAAVNDAARKLAKDAAHVRLVHQARIKIVAELHGRVTRRRAHHDPGRQAIQAVAGVQVGNTRLLLYHLDERMEVVSPRRVNRDAAWLDHHDPPLRVVAMQDLDRSRRHSRLVSMYPVDDQVVILDEVRGRHFFAIHRA